MIKVFRLRFVILIMFLTITDCVYAVITDAGLLTGNELYVNQHKKVFFYVRTENWLYSKFPQANNELLRPAIAYNVTDKLSLWLGYDLFLGIINPSFLAHGVWEQAEYILIRNSSMDIVSRSRFAQLFHPVATGVSMRFRERFLFKFKKLTFNSVTPVVFNEAFINTNHPDWVSKKTLSQNRLFVGVQLPIFAHTTLRVGYLNQQFFDDKTVVNHVMYLNLIAYLE